MIKSIWSRSYVAAYIIISLPWKRREKSAFVRHFFAICDPKSFAMSYFLVPLLGQMNPVPYETFFFYLFLFFFSYFTFFRAQSAHYSGSGMLAGLCVCVWSKTESVAVLRLFMDLYFFSLSSLLGQSGLLCVSNTPTPPPPSIVTFRTRSRLFVIIFETDLTFTCHTLSCLRRATHAQLITISWLKTLYSRCSN